MYKFLVVAAFQVACVLAALPHEKKPLSSLIPLCSVKDPNLNRCIKNAASKMVPVLAKGIREYGLVSWDPLFIPRMEIGENNGPINLKLIYINATQTGLANMVIDNFEVDLKKGRFVVNTTHPTYTLTGKYQAQGKILVLPINGDGVFNATQIGTKCDMVIQAHLEKKNGHQYYKVDSSKVYYKFGKIYLDYTNLFKGNEELSRSTNKFLNDNAALVFEGMKKALQDTYGGLFGEFIKRLFDSVPYDQLFKDV